jgi:guanylate kinase
MPDALLVFLAPPSREELERRLIGRGTEDPAERARRLQTAEVELAAMNEFDVAIVNDDVTTAAAELVDLLRFGTSADSRSRNV